MHALLCAFEVDAQNAQEIQVVGGTIVAEAWFLQDMV